MTVRRPLILGALLCASVVLSAGCRVSDPTIDQVIPWNLPLDQVPDQVDVPYGDQPIQRLDVYRPKVANAGVAIVFLHSGGWISGNKDAARTHGIPQWLMDRGYTILSANYTLGANGISGFPANVNDVKRAIAWANAHKADLGVSKVVVGGTSAGGHLAMLATTTSHAVPPGVAGSVRPDAGMSWSGPIDMMTWGGAQGGYQQPIEWFWGSGWSHPSQIPELARIAASPQAFVDPGDPPIFLSSGEVDPFTPAAFNANVLEQRYIDVGPGDQKAWNDIVEGSNDHNLTFTNIAAAHLFLQYLVNGQL
jgi:acetyl esterase/lipase